jgi:hypothetical protein
MCLCVAKKISYLFFIRYLVTQKHKKICAELQDLLILIKTHPKTF